jgi:hypothetical protein
MVSIFLELDSTFRDRNLWPHPGEFQVSFSQSGRSINQDMLDPVCVAVPEKVWTGKFFNVNNLGNDFVQAQILDEGIGNSSTANEIMVSSVNGEIFQKKYNYYNHAVIRSAVPDVPFVRIIRSTYMGRNRMKLALRPALTFNVLDVLEIVDPTDLTDPNNSFFFVPDGSNNEQDYLNHLLYNESLNLSLPIKSYDSQTGLVAVKGNTTGWLPTHNFGLRKQNPNYVLIAGANSTPTQISLPVVPGDFSNWFIRVPKIIYNNTTLPPQGETRRIVKYDAPNAIISPPFSATPATLAIELMQQGYDNVNSFTWRGTVTQEVPTYRINLKRLILPNLPMSISRGGAPSIANYFYVELSNVGTQTLYNICSNNPFACKAVFRVTVKEFVRLEDLEFITLEGDTEQTIRLRIDSSIHFKVFSSTGELFKTVINDNFTPLAPKYNIQVNALFELQQV